MQIVGKKINPKGDCECCNRHTEPVELFQQHGMLMCSICRDAEISVIERTRQAQTLIQESRKIDSDITLVADILNAKTIPIQELRAAIQQDGAIPDDQKEYAFSKECLTRVQHLDKVIFEMQQSLVDKQNERRAWQTNGQASAGKLRAELRAEFQTFDITYAPAPVKTPKPKIVKPAKKAFNKAECYAAAKKFNVPADRVQSMMVSKNYSNYEDAAKRLAEMMGLL